MRSCHWLIINLKWLKGDRPKQGKVHSAGSKANDSNWRCLSGKETCNLRVGPSSKKTFCTRFTEYTAATRIQTAYRAYVARKAVRCLRGIVRLHARIEDYPVTKQAPDCLNHINFWCKIQKEIKARRQYMVTEGRMRQKKLENQLKLEARIHELEVEWCGGSESMEEILQRIQQREAAAGKRERTMAYSFSHQWRADSNPYFGQSYYDLGKESWGWSWMERWIAVRPWEQRVQAKSTIPKKFQRRQMGKVRGSTKFPSIKIIVNRPLPNEKGSG